MQYETEKLLLRIPSRVTSMPDSLNNGVAAREVPLGGYRGVLVSAALDGKPAGELAFAPYQCELGEVAKGEHTLDLTLYGSRVNSAGSVHLTFRVRWAGPGAWRTEGDMFSYDYQVQPLRHHGRAAAAEEITPGRRRLNRRLRYGRKPESGVSGAPGPGFLFRPASRNRRGRRTERHYRLRAYP